MLLIDGVKYELWTPPTEDKFEQVVKEHTQEIFGEQSIYLDLKQKLKSGSGIGSIPDGYVIVPSDSPHWHIVEVELSFHPLHDHIVSQVGRFIGGISSPNIQRGIVNAIDEEITKDDFLKVKLRKAVEPVEIHRFLTDLVSKQPIITIIIEKATEELREALNILRYPQIEVVEFQTFTREGVGLDVHVHLFEPVHSILPSPLPATPPPTPPVKKEGAIAGRVTFAELVNAGLLQDGQVLYFYHTRLFSDERAQVIASENKLRYQADGNLYSKTELAEQLFRKYGFKYVALRGPQYWKTEDGRLLVELEEQVRIQRGDRK